MWSVYALFLSAWKCWTNNRVDVLVIWDAMMSYSVASHLSPYCISYDVEVVSSKYKWTQVTGLAHAQSVHSRLMPPYLIYSPFIALKRIFKIDHYQTMTEGRTWGIVLGSILHYIKMSIQASGLWSRIPNNYLKSISILRSAVSGVTHRHEHNRVIHFTSLLGVIK